MTPQADLRSTSVCLRGLGLPLNIAICLVIGTRQNGCTALHKRADQRFEAQDTLHKLMTPTKSGGNSGRHRFLPRFWHTGRQFWVWSQLSAVIKRLPSLTAVFVLWHGIPALTSFRPLSDLVLVRGMQIVDMRS